MFDKFHLIQKTLYKISKIPIHYDCRDHVIFRYEKSFWQVLHCIFRDFHHNTKVDQIRRCVAKKISLFPVVDDKTRKYSENRESCNGDCVYLFFADDLFLFPPQAQFSNFRAEKITGVLIILLFIFLSSAARAVTYE